MKEDAIVIIDCARAINSQSSTASRGLFFPSNEPPLPPPQKIKKGKKKENAA